MKRLISRYSISYPRSLVYMLQASEYRSADYVSWLGRVRNFRTVEFRKHIVWSMKAVVLWLSAWGIFALWCTVAFGAALATGGSVPLLFALGATLLAPLILPYALLIPLSVFNAAQRPFERALVTRAQKRLSEHAGLKIAIAGSFGKTTMREIVKTVLSEGKNVAAAPGSYNTPLGIAKFVESLSGDEDVLVFELGEYYPGDIRSLCEFVKPQWGIVTGVNEAHLEKFGTLDKTTATIFELADFLGSRPLYVNAENPTAKNHAPAEAVFYSRKGVGEWSIEQAHADLTGTRFTMRSGAISISANSRLLGLHMIGPIAAAAHIGLALGLTISQVEKGIERTIAFEHRLEPKTDAGGVVTLDDSYNGNPDGAAAVIDFLASLKGRRFYVTPGLVEMGFVVETVHRDIGKRLAGAGIEQVVLIRNSVTPYIEKGLLESGYGGTITWFEDGPSAYAALPYMTVPGDIVLLQNDWPDQYA